MNGGELAHAEIGSEAVFRKSVDPRESGPYNG